MATDNNYDYTQDPQFLQAHPDQQHAYLMENNPNYAKAHPDQQRAYLGHVNGGGFTDRGASANPPTPKAGIPLSTNEMLGEGEETQAEGNAEMGREYVHGGPMEIARGAWEAATGNTPRGLHRMAKGAGITAIPLAASTLPIAMAEAPAATIGAVAGGTIAQPLGKAAAKGMGASEDWSDVAGDVTGAAGTMVGAGTGKLASDLTGSIGKMSYEKPTKIDLPFKLGRIKVGEDPTIEEEAALASKRKLAQRDADIAAGVTQHPGVPAHAQMEKEIVEGKQKMAAGRDTAYNDLARSRNARTGDVNTEGQQASEGHSIPLGPAVDEFYGNRGANLVGRTGDVATEGQQMSEGHTAPLGPAKPTPEETLTRQEKAGKAAKLPNRIPRQAAGGGTAADVEAASRRASEGSPARWTNDRVYELASQGNRDALMEIRQRGLEPPPNSRYVTGDVSANKVRTGPLTLSTSETEHMPISPGGKVRGVSVNQPRETVKFDAQGNPVPPPTPPEAGPTVGNGKPLARGPSGPNKVTPAAPPQEAPPSTPQSGTERRAIPRGDTSKFYQNADPIRTGRMDDLRTALRGQDLTLEERRVMQDQLNDLEAHPNERNEIGEDANAFRNKPTLSKEEAEAASNKRTEGRNARFKPKRSK